MSKTTTRPIFSPPSQSFKTDRLLIRPITLNDVEAFHKLRRQPEVMITTTTGKIDEDPAATLKWVQRFVDPNDRITFSFAIEELSNPGDAVGTIGCHIAEPPQLGYMFRSEFWGRGYATEALRAWLPRYWALERREVDLVEPMLELDIPTRSVGNTTEVLSTQIEEANVASIRIMEKCGFKRTGKEDKVEDFRGPATIVWFYLERQSAA